MNQTAARPIPTTHSEVLAFYQDKLDRQQAILKQASDRWGYFSFVRGGSFLACLAPLFMGFATVGGYRDPWFILAGLIFLGFLVTAFIHEGMAAEIRRSKLLVGMYRESIARCTRDWTSISVSEIEVPEDHVAACFDLDLTGDSSVFKLLGIVRTPLGTKTLSDWIIHGSTDVEEIAARQKGVAELTSNDAYREKFSLLCSQLGSSRSGPSRFVDWAESPRWFIGKEWLLNLSRVTAAVSIGTLLVILTGLVSLEITGPIIVGSLVVNFLLSVFFAGSMHDTFNKVSSNENEITHYVSLFQMVTEFETESPYLKQIQSDLVQDGDDIRTHVAALSRLTWAANWRRNGVLFLAYLFFEFFVFWDAHVLDQLEKWKTRHGHKAERWFAALGRWEAILALSKLAHDNPQWKYPTVTKQDSKDVIVECKRMGHPLLGEERVPNDVTVGPPGTVLLVTGSNMSGKSTLLRSLGVNIVLAQMGSVVCASEMTLSPIRIETSMRIVDSLKDGVSFFMAELKRLKSIVDIAQRQKQVENQTMMFLLDEILQGTNSRERQIAVSSVVKKLIDEHAVGAISTHDLDLATTDDLEKACRTVHFSEQFSTVDGQRKMTFDYKMKQGIAETTNALKLLEIVGLGD